MSICVLNAYSPAYAELAKLTTHGNRQEYCYRHGYDLLTLTKTDSHGQFTWDRFKWVTSVLKSQDYEWIYCCGVDTLHTNLKIPLESFLDGHHHVVIASDWCAPVQADSFFVRSSPQGMSYMDAVLNHYSEDQSHPWVENQSMIRELPNFKEIIKLVPQRALNAYNYSLYESVYPTESKVKSGLDYYGNDGRWQVGDFLIHWPGLSLSVRLKEVQKTMKLVIQ